MDIPDAVCGRLILVTTSTLFIVISFWINTYPFIDEESSIYSVTPDSQWLLLFCAVWGLFFIGGLMSFTLYHILPYV